MCRATEDLSSIKLEPLAIYWDCEFLIGISKTICCYLPYLGESIPAYLAQYRPKCAQCVEPDALGTLEGTPSMRNMVDVVRYGSPVQTRQCPSPNVQTPNPQTLAPELWHEDIARAIVAAADANDAEQALQRLRS